MANQWGRLLRITLFGESHGVGVGLVLEGLPPGFAVDLDHINEELARRRPGHSQLTSSRSETDEFEIISGLKSNRTTGAPLTVLLRNKDPRSRDYQDIRYQPRPGHADFTAYIKYRGHNDHRGGGQFSGRLTAPVVFAGALAKQWLFKNWGTVIGSHLLQIGALRDDCFDPAEIDSDLLERLCHTPFPVLNEAIRTDMLNLITEVQKSGNSVGGIVECAAVNLPAGIGEPWFDSVESTIAHLAFSIPGVKALEFGSGFKLAAMYGSQANDEFCTCDNRVITTSNHAGGVLGGITNGMPVLFRVAFKPTPSIKRAQQTVDLRTMQPVVIELEGRHDPCIAIRAVPVVEAVCALALMELGLAER